VHQIISIFPPQQIYKAKIQVKNISCSFSLYTFLNVCVRSRAAQKHAITIETAVFAIFNCIVKHSGAESAVLHQQ
jgi:hypothetical protein